MASKSPGAPPLPPTVAREKPKYPYAAIEHRVIDSPAYADLSFSARALLQLLARQLTRDNNGQLQATFSYCSRFGFGSEKTLRHAIADLIAHGFIYRTRSHGANGAWARYAVTWLPICSEHSGLFLDGFSACAWQNWYPLCEKSSRQKVLEHPVESAGTSGRKCSFAAPIPAQSAGNQGAKNAEYEFNVIRIGGVERTDETGPAPISRDAKAGGAS